MNNKVYKVIIFEPSEIVVEGLQCMLKPLQYIQVIGAYNNLLHFQERILRYTPDVIIINPALVSIGGWSEINNAITDEVKIGLQYQFADSETLKQFSTTIDIFDTQKQLNSKIEKALSVERNVDAGGDSEELSEREKEILAAVARGMMNKEIAEKFFISIHTVISHRKNITRKTGIKSVAGLTVYALLNNLIDQNEIQ